MSFVTCSVDGCSRKLQPVVKPDPRDRETWIYRECDQCFRPVCEEHSTDIDGRLICDRCRRQLSPPSPEIELLDLGLEPMSRSRRR